ncbi:MAG: glycosyltransferase family 4 protein [Spirochaetaceae bacterium]|nr:glycosyltransferase family 4 protein [Spirochaetaceae bacterium]
MDMKILIINTYDISGGAARAAFRLHEALLQNNIDSQMLVADKRSDISSVITPYQSKFEKLFWKLCFFRDQLSAKKHKKTEGKKFGPLSVAKIKNKKLVKAINSINPDIVHLHWICHGFLAIEDIARINAPIVWSLHDMWAFTGGCHYVGGVDKECDKYTRSCGSCELLESNKAKDLSFKVLQRKKKAYAKVKSMTIIGLSKWLQSCTKSSSLFTDKRVINLPNPINTGLFKPFDIRAARKLFNLPEDKKLVLFGAMDATSTPYKGFTELIKALNKIKTENVEFVVFGSSEPKNPPSLPCKVHYLGHLHDDITLVLLYSACDVIIVPSKRENLSNVIMESLSCGTPVVCFDIGGNSDMVTHKVSGYLAQPFDTSGLAEGIDWVLNNENCEELSKNAREKIVNEFDHSIVVKKYIDLYKEVIALNL